MPALLTWEWLLLSDAKFTPKMPPSKVRELTTCDPTAGEYVPPFWTRMFP